MMAGVSIGQLFLAGVIPGILMGATMMLTVAWFAWRAELRRATSRSRPARLIKAGLEIALVFVLPLIWVISRSAFPPAGRSSSSPRCSRSTGASSSTP